MECLDVLWLLLVGDFFFSSCLEDDHSMHTHLGHKFALHEERPSSSFLFFLCVNKKTKARRKKQSHKTHRRKTIKEQWTQPTTTRHNNHLIIISAFGPVLEHINFMWCFNFSVFFSWLFASLLRLLAMSFVALFHCVFVLFLFLFQFKVIFFLLFFSMCDLVSF